MTESIYKIQNNEGAFWDTQRDEWDEVGTSWPTRELAKMAASRFLRFAPSKAAISYFKYNAQLKEFSGAEELEATFVWELAKEPLNYGMENC